MQWQSDQSQCHRRKYVWQWRWIWNVVNDRLIWIWQRLSQYWQFSIWRWQYKYLQQFQYTKLWSFRIFHRRRLRLEQQQIWNLRSEQWICLWKRYTVWIWSTNWRFYFWCPVWNFYFRKSAQLNIWHNAFLWFHCNSIQHLWAIQWFQYLWSGIFTSFWICLQ